MIPIQMLTEIEHLARIEFLLGTIVCIGICCCVFVIVYFFYRGLGSLF